MMALFRASRERRGPDRFLAHKMVLFAVGTAIAFLGIILDRPWLVNVGIVILALGLVLRVIGARQADADPDEDGDPSP